MPRGDGTGPPTTGGKRSGRMMGNRRGSGPGGNCICPGCGKKLPHRQGNPCYSVDCPSCRTKMKRE